MEEIVNDLLHQGFFGRFATRYSNLASVSDGELTHSLIQSLCESRRGPALIAFADVAVVPA